MTIAKGIIGTTPRLIEAVPLTRDDLEVLRAPRHQATIAERFRDPHHHLARLLALGMKQKDAATAVGYSVTRVSQLEASPAFQELIAVYREKVTQKFLDNAEELMVTMAGNLAKAQRTIAEHFDKADEEGELIPLDKALRVSADIADRLGPAKKSVSTNLNVNADFASLMEKAMARSSRVVDITPNPVTPVASGVSPASAVERTVPAPAEAAPIIRRRRVA